MHAIFPCLSTNVCCKNVLLTSVIQKSTSHSQLQSYHTNHITTNIHKPYRNIIIVLYTSLLYACSQAQIAAPGTAWIPHELCNIQKAGMSRYRYATLYHPLMHHSSSQLEEAGFDHLLSKHAHIVYLDAPNAATGQPDKLIAQQHTPPYFEWGNADQVC